MPNDAPGRAVTATDEILLEGMRFYAFHGVHAEERKLGQRFSVDLTLSLDLRQAGRSDDLAQTVSYSEVFRTVRRIVEGEPRALIEAVAEDIATTVLVEYPRVAGIEVTLRKLEAPIKGAMLDAAAVRIRRWRDKRE